MKRRPEPVKPQYVIRIHEQHNLPLWFSEWVNSTASEKLTENWVLKSVASSAYTLPTNGTFSYGWPTHLDVNAKVIEANTQVSETCHPILNTVIVEHFDQIHV